MAEKEQFVTFISEDGDEAKLRVLEQTKLNGNNYLLVLDDFEDEDEEALILKEIKDENDMVTYEVVDNDKELSALLSIFEELLEDTDLVFEGK